MQFNALVENVSKMFPQEKNETDEAYAFFLSESLQDFRNRPGDLTSVWESIRAYDGNTKRPKFAFFITIAMGTKSSSPEGTAYWYCESCKTNLSISSDGGCPICRTAAHTVRKISKKPITYTACQSPCFDCSIYSEMAIGPGCKDFNHGYSNCEIKNTCKCNQCCRFEYMKTYHAKRFKGREYEDSLKRLPRPISEAGKAFQDGRASFVDLIQLYKSRESK